LRRAKKERHEKRGQKVLITRPKDRRKKKHAKREVRFGNFRGKRLGLRGPVEQPDRGRGKGRTKEPSGKTR